MFYISSVVCSHITHIMLLWNCLFPSRLSDGDKPLQPQCVFARFYMYVGDTWTHLNTFDPAVLCLIEYYRRNTHWCTQLLCSRKQKKKLLCCLVLKVTSELKDNWIKSAICCTKKRCKNNFPYDYKSFITYFAIKIKNINTFDLYQLLLPSFHCL